MSAIPSYMGINLAPPKPVQYPTMQAGNIQSYLNAFQQGQNQSNLANNQRYGQGLGVLSQGGNAANNFAQQGQNYIQQVGGAQREQIEMQRQAGLGSANQNAISRGLGDTTITDALQQGVQRTANLAQNDLSSKLAQLQSNQSNVQAQYAQGGANSLAGFIGSRNDTGPDGALLANLMRGAVNPYAGQRTGTVSGGGSFGAPSDFMRSQAGSGGVGGALNTGSQIAGYSGGQPYGWNGMSIGGNAQQPGQIGQYLGAGQAGSQSAPGSDPGTGGGYAFFGNNSYVLPGGQQQNQTSLVGGNGARELPPSTPPQQQTAPAQTSSGNPLQDQIAQLQKMVNSPANGDGYYSALLANLMKQQA